MLHIAGMKNASPQFDLVVELQKADDERRTEDDARTERRDNTVRAIVVNIFAMLLTTALLGG
jgi:hypothetical protein